MFSLVREDEEDDLDMKMSELSVAAFHKGDKVLILTGHYAGETGTIQTETRTMTGSEGELNYWVQLDADEDAIVYRPEELERITESSYEADDDFMKEIGEAQPQFEYEPFESAGSREYTLVRTANNLIRHLSEDDWEDEDVIDTKDYNYSQLDMIVAALKRAGFKVEEASLNNNQLSVAFSYPYVSATTYVGGLKRAMEAIGPFIVLRPENCTAHKNVEDKIVTVYINKRAETGPGQWKMKPAPMPATFTGVPHFFEVFFNDENVGEAYIEGSCPFDSAERLREELAELNDVVPFNPNEWTAKGDDAGHGPAIAWWRRNRSRLENPEANRPFFYPRLIAEPGE